MKSPSSDSLRNSNNSTTSSVNPVTGNPTNNGVDYTSRTANNRISVLQRNKPLVAYGLLANTVYFFGTIFFLAFSAFELQNKERETAAILVYTMAFVLFLGNALAELFMDLRLAFSEKIRNVRHGRYSKKQYFNLAISTLFLIGTILDIAAFVLWMERQFVTEHQLLYVSSHAWLLTAILTLAASVPFVQTEDVMEGLDDAGNLLFLCCCIISCIVRYTDTEFATGSPPPPVARLEFTAAPIYVVSGLCYTVSDVMRLQKARQNDSGGDAE